MPFPSEIKGAWIWTEIIPQLVPEIDFANLLILGTIAKQKNKVEMYNSLRASLRKIHWTKVAGMRAIAIEQDIANQKEPNTLILDPFGITDHSLCITDCLIHTKSALDSMAVFLNDLLELHVKQPADRDLKHEGFRNRIVYKDHVIGKVVKELSPWIDDLQKLRDEWIHRSTVTDAIIIGPSTIGVLPLPKKPDISLGVPITPQNSWSTSDFVKFHYNQFVRLFNVVVEGAIQIEAKGLDRIPASNPEEAGMAFFSTKLTEGMTVKAIRLSNLAVSSYYLRLSELFRQFEVSASKVDGSGFEFLTELSKGLWRYTCSNFGFPVDIPEIKVMFVPEIRFKQLLGSEKTDDVDPEKKAVTVYKGYLDAEGKQECYFVILQVSRLCMAKEFFNSYLNKAQSTSETVLRLLIHGNIRVYEETTRKELLKSTQKPITDDEINIYDKFRIEHPEYFTEQSNEHMNKTIEKIPAN